MISAGIDVSKDKSTVCIMKPGGEMLASPFEILHAIDSILALVNRLKQYDDEVRVVLETTGHYHWPVISLLVEQGVFVACINALRMKKFCAQNIRKGKTDSIDAIKTANYGITYWSELVCCKGDSDTYTELRTYSRQYYQYTEAKINLSNLLDQAMPGINTLLIDQDGKHKLTDFVRKHYHFANINKMSEADFIIDFCDWAKKGGYRISESKAKDIYVLSKNSIHTLPSTESTKILVLESVRILQELEKSRNTILAHVEELANLFPEYSILVAIDGVGSTLATRFITEVGSISRFHNKNALVPYAGIDSPPYQSGAFTATKRSISKRGNKYLRKTGFEIMQSIMRQKPSFDDSVFQFILKKQAEGKSSKVANFL